MSAYLSSVPTEHLQTISAQFRSAIARVADQGLDMKRMAMLIERGRLRVLNQMETDATDSFATGVISDFLYGDRKGSDLVEATQGEMNRWKTFGSWTADQWATELRRCVPQSLSCQVKRADPTWLEGGSLTTRALSSSASPRPPSPTSSMRTPKPGSRRPNPSLEKKVLRSCRRTSTQRRRRMTSRSRKRFSSRSRCPRSIPSDGSRSRPGVLSPILPRLPRLPMTSRNFWTTTRPKSPFLFNSTVSAFSTAPGPSAEAQRDPADVESNFLTLTANLSPANLPSELHGLLPIYLGAFFSLPLQRADGTELTFEQVVQELDRETIEYDIRLGPVISQTLELSIKVEKTKYASTVRWLRDLLWGLKFDVDRCVKLHPVGAPSLIGLSGYASLRPR